MITTTLHSISLADPLVARNELKQEAASQIADQSTKSGIQLKPGRLYDREIEQEQLLRAFQRISRPNCQNRELVLITGCSGTGKTQLAQGLKEKVVASGGLFLQGKWDQFQTPEPYAPIVSAFTEYANLIVKQGEDSVAEMKKIIEKETESDYHLLTDMIPALKQILTVETAGTGMKGADTHTRFRLIFRKFVNAISSTNRPVVLVLDDIQWADVGSLNLIKTMVMDRGNNGFMILGTCRGNEVALDDPLSVMLRELEDSGVIVVDIKLEPLCADTVTTIIAEMFNLSDEATAALSSIVFDQTHGNCIYIMQYLQTLYAHNLLIFDKNAGEWTWDHANTRSEEKSKDVVELVGEEIEKLPRSMREILKIASCIGSEFDKKILDDIVGGDVNAMLKVAEAKGLLVMYSSNGACRWTHDKVQQAAYQQILQTERAAFHLELGRKLWNHLPRDDLTFNIFLVVRQLHLGINLMDDQDERDRMAALCLQAGERAMKSSAFVAASEYLDLGISLLGLRHWRDYYDVSLSLFCSSCEIEYCNANFDKMDYLISEILENSRNFKDGIRAITTKIHSFGAKNQTIYAIETGMDVLRELGQGLPKKARLVYIVGDFIKTKRMLRKFTEDQILNLPVMKNDDHLAATKILSLLYPYTFICQPEMAPLITFRLIQLTLRYGISPISSTAFATYGMLLCMSFNEVNEGYRYGQLAMRLQNHFATPEWYPRTAVAVHGMIFTWKDDIKLSIEPLMAAHRIGLATGDIEFAMLSAALYATCSIHSGRSLRDIAGENWKFQELMLMYKQTQMLSMLLPNMQVVLNLMGQGYGNAWELTGEAMNEKAELDSATATMNGSVVTTIHLYKLFLAYYLQEFEDAMTAAKNLRRCRLNAVSSVGVCMHAFLEGLTVIALAHTSNKRRNRRLGRKKLKILKNLQLLGPENTRNKVALLEAEVFFLDGNVELALGKYDSAIELADKQGFIQEHALACERKAFALESIGQTEAGHELLRQARSLYEEWGSALKVDHVTKRLLLKLSVPATI